MSHFGAMHAMRMGVALLPRLLVARDMAALLTPPVTSGNSDQSPGLRAEQGTKTVFS